MHEIDSEDAAFIDAVILEARLGGLLTVDRSRLGDSHEAWVHVQIHGEENSLFQGFGPYPRSAILTWPNSD